MAATRTFWAAALAVVTAAAVLTGCGGKDDAADAPIVEPAASGSASAGASADASASANGGDGASGPFAGDSAQRIEDEADAAMKAATALTVDLRGTDDDGSALHIAAALTDSGKCAASIEHEDETIQVIRVGGTYYLKADAEYWREEGGPHGDTLAQTFAGKWAELPGDGVAEAFDSFCDLSTMLGSLTEDDPSTDGPVTKGAPTSRYGRPVQPLVQAEEDGTTTTAYVAATGSPYYLGFETSDGSDTARFTGFDKAAHISAPPVGDTVQLGSGDTPALSA